MPLAYGCYSRYNTVICRRMIPDYLSVCSGIIRKKNTNDSPCEITVIRVTQRRYALCRTGIFVSVRYMQKPALLKKVQVNKHKCIRYNKAVL